MGTDVAIALIGGIVTVLGTLIGAYVSLRKHQSKTHTLVNGRMDELLEAQMKIAKAHGIEIGKEIEKEGESK